MNEPPIISGNSDNFAPAPDDRPLDNPYAPAVNVGDAANTPNGLDLPWIYWGVLAVVFPAFAAACYFAPGIGIPGGIALVSAVIRVPLMQVRQRPVTMMELPKPLLLLLTSWVLSLVIGVASTIAFCAICIPTGILAFSVNGEGVAVPIVFGLSGVIALIVYVFLFRLSLRMSV